MADMSLILLALAALGGYLAGSIPFGLVLTRAAGLGDIRQIGSGNIGATNVLRTGNKPLAAATLILDAGKGGFVALGLLLAGLPEAAILGGVAAVFGHNFPVWLGFKGGKGVATTLGVLAALSWPVGIACCATWLVVAGLFRFSSLAALVALAAAPAYAWYLAPAMPWLPWAAAILAVLAFIRHRANIARLMKGEEPKIGRKKG